MGWKKESRIIANDIILDSNKSTSSKFSGKSSVLMWLRTMAEHYSVLFTITRTIQIMCYFVRKDSSLSGVVLAVSATEIGCKDGKRIEGKRIVC